MKPLAILIAVVAAVIITGYVLPSYQDVLAHACSAAPVAFIALALCMGWRWTRRAVTVKPVADDGAKAQSLSGQIIAHAQPRQTGYTLLTDGEWYWVNGVEIRQPTAENEG